jgi:hypothetical protein
MNVDVKYIIICAGYGKGADMTVYYGAEPVNRKYTSDLYYALAYNTRKEAQKASYSDLPVDAQAIVKTISKKALFATKLKGVAA